MLLPYLAKKTNSLSAEWDRVRSRIKTATELEERNRFVREKIIAMLGGFPERNPPRPIVGRVLERDGYRIENVMFQSRPNFLVTGNLYVPVAWLPATRRRGQDARAKAGGTPALPRCQPDVIRNHL